MSCATVVSPIEIFSADDVGRRRRRDWTDAEKIRIVEESLRGYRQGSATARRYGISRSLLSIWRRDYRSGGLGGVAAPLFMPVSIPAPETAPCEVMPAPQVGNDVRIEITLTNGRRLTISALLDPTILARLLPVLDTP